MTDQASNSSTEPESPGPSGSLPEGETHRYTFVAAVGIAGTEEDCERFMNLMVEDFQARCYRANEKIFKNRITILPIEETLPEEGSGEEEVHESA